MQKHALIVLLAGIFCLPLSAQNTYGLSKSAAERLPASLKMPWQGNDEMRLDTIRYYTDYTGGDSLLRNLVCYNYAGDTFESATTYSREKLSDPLIPVSRYSNLRNAAGQTLVFTYEFLIDGQLTPIFKVKQFPSTGGAYEWDSIQLFNYDYDSKILYYESVEYGYEVDTSGNVTARHYKYFKLNGSLKYYGLTRIYYDSLGRVTGRILKRAYPGNQYLPTDSTSIHYIDAMAFTKVLLYSNGQWKKQSQQIDIANADSTKLEHYYFYWEPTQYNWQLNSILVEILDDQGRLIEQSATYQPYTPTATVDFENRYYLFDKYLDYIVASTADSDGNSEISGKTFFFYSGSSPVITPEKQDESVYWQVWPNPATDVVWVQASEEISHATLFDLNGRILRTKAGNAQRLQLERGDLPPGYYPIQVTIHNQLFTGLILFK